VERLTKKNRAMRYTFAAIFTIMSAGIINAGYIYYLNYKTQYKTEIEEQLSAIGRLKAEELSYWRKERLADGRIFYKNADFSQLVSKYFNDPNDTNAQEQIKAWLNISQASYQYDKCMLLDAQYRKKIIIPEGNERPVSYVSEDTSKVLQSGEMAFEDFYWNEESKQIYLKVLVPILEKEGGRMIGAVAIRIDPKKYLYPFIENWPVPSMTAESQLVRKGGNGVQFLNELKFQKDTALKLSRSIANKDLPSVKAVLGYEGIIDGIDYRGKPVIADVRAVPDSPWFLVTKMDESEIYAPLQKKQWSIIVFIGVLLAGAGASVGFVLKRRTAGIYQQKYDEAKEWNKTFDAIGDMVSVVDKDMRLKTVNKTFADVFGKQPEELVGKRCCELVHGTKEPPENCPMRKTLSTKETASTEIYYEALRKHLEISTYPVLDDKGEVAETVHFIRDITKRKLMEEGRRRTDVQLRDSLRFTQEVISSASVGVVVYDTQLRYVEWNTFMEKMTGMKKKDVVGKNALEIFPHLREQGVDKLLGRALAGETVSSPDVAYRCPQTGKTGWVISTYTPHHNSTGRIIGVIGIVRDITERRQTEEFLKNNEIRFRELFENMSSAVAVYDAENDGDNFIFKDCNWTLLDIERINKEQVIGRRVTEVFPGVKEFGIFEVFQRVYRTGNAEHFPVSLYKDERVSGWKENYVYKLPSGEVIAIYDDVTERRQAEELLKNSENMFRSIATAVPVGLGAASGRTIQWVNDYLLHLVGRQREEIIGEDTRILYENDEGYNLVGDKYYKDLREKGKAEIRVNWKHKDGRILNILLTGVALNKEEVSQGIVFAALDITDRKQAEEELHKSSVGVN
jgi:PAS domain S-box-containing protein